MLKLWAFGVKISFSLQLVVSVSYCIMWHLNYSSVLLQSKRQFNKLAYHGILRVRFPTIFRPYPPFGSPPNQALSRSPHLLHNWKNATLEIKARAIPIYFWHISQHATANRSLYKFSYLFWQISVQLFFEEKLEQSWSIFLLTGCDSFCNNFYFQGRYWCQLSQIIEHYLLQS